jgi:predicted  nucleic acid-binding Zn-ribbon protein
MPTNDEEMDEQVLERIEAQIYERYQQSLEGYFEGAQSTTTARRKADLQDRLARLDRKIKQVKHDLADLSIERAASVGELDALETGIRDLARKCD